MGIREKLNQNPGITTGITIGIIVIALGAIIWQLFGGEGVPAAITQVYYTTDDGKTYFADDVNKVVPFEKDGKEAVRCHVYTCSDGKPFVAYLERLSKEAKPKYEAALKAQQNQDPNSNAPAGPDPEQIAMEGTEVKRPGDTKWLLRHQPEAEKVTQINCPDGNNSALNVVLPQ